MWQSASPQRNFANWQFLGQIRSAFRIRPRYCFSFRAAAGDADCHVASLLAMTSRNLPRVCVCQGALPESVLATANTCPSSACHCVLAPRTPAKFPHVLAPNVLAPAHTPLPSACHCEPVRTLVRQSASPQGNFTNWQFLGQIRSAFRIRPKYCFSFCFTARRTDCHVASLLAMTCKRQRRCCGCKGVGAMTCKRRGRCFEGARDTKRSKAGLPLSEAAPKHYLAPLWSNTTPMVRKIHFKSSAIERSRMYCISNWIFSSGRRSYPPDTWARPVSPGLTTMR